MEIGFAAMYDTYLERPYLFEATYIYACNVHAYRKYVLEGGLRSIVTYICFIDFLPSKNSPVMVSSTL